MRVLTSAPRIHTALLLGVAGVASCAAQPVVFDLADAGAGPVLIAYGEGLEAQAQRLGALCREATGRDAEVCAASTLVEPGTWRLAESALSRPLVLLGSVANNEGLFALYSHWLEGANAAYPGPNRYVLRTLSEPLRRSRSMLTLGAADAAGLDAGLARLEQLLRANGGRFPPLIESGTAAGPHQPAGASPPDFPGAATEFFWHGLPVAGAKARQLLLDEMARREKGLWGFHEGGHYDWERHYRPLLQLLASGLLTEEERTQVDARLATNFLENSDWAYLAYANAPAEQAAVHLDRHQLSALVGGFIVLEYLHHVGRVAPERQEAVRQRYEHLAAHCNALVASRHFCTQITGTEGADTLNMLADLYLQYGDRRVVIDGTLRRMADGYFTGKDNLGWHASDDCYIGCRPGCHFARSSGGATWLLAGHFCRDGGYRWLLENQHAFLTHFQVARPPETVALLAHLPSEEPTRYCGVHADPLDPYWYRQCTERPADESAVPVRVPIESLFSRAAFRDGFGPDNAYLLFQGTDRASLNPGYPYMANAISRYTELGSLLLFANSMKQTGWAQSVVSASRGKPDPQSTACALDASLNTGLVSALQSRHDQHGGTCWVRTLVRRHGGYFVVLDRLTAAETDTYLFVCRWRSYHQGGMVAPATFEAIDGMNQVRFRLSAATPAAWTVETEKQDGAARPTVVRQVRREPLAAGASVSFANLFYATDAEHPREFAVRALSETAVLVRGHSEAFEELAAVGVERVALPGFAGEARLWYAGRGEVALCGVRNCRLGDRVTLAGDREFSLTVAAGAGWIENPAAQDLTLRVTPDAGAAPLLDARPLASATATIPPGRQQFELAGTAELLTGLAAELERQWATAESAEALPAPPLEVAGQAAPSLAWEQAGVLPGLSDHGDVLIRAEPATTIGEAATWRNRLIGPPYGYGWHGSERAGWSQDAKGTMAMDLGAEVDIADIQLVRSRRLQTEAGAFNPGEFEFDLSLSNDGFANDVRQRVVKDALDGIYYRQNTLYTYTQRFPLITVPVQSRARYVKLTPRRVVEVRSPPADYYGTYSDDEVSFMGVFVHRTDREPRREARLWSADFGQGPAFLYHADRTLRLISLSGKTLWERTLDAAPAALTQLADVDGDGRLDVLVFTLAETLTAFRGEDGTELSRLDVKEKLGLDLRTSSWSPYRPCAFGCWRPDASGHPETWFFPHYNCVQVGPGPDPACRRIEQPGGNRGGKFAFTVPDVTGDGREELAVVGLYGGGQVGIIASDAAVEGGSLAKYLAVMPVKGYNSGNMELELYWSGGVIRDAQGRWLGAFALNPGGINAYRAPDFRELWSHFHHPPNLACVTADLDGDGVPEIVVGREDGYVLAYAALDGATVAKMALDGAVRSLAWTGDHVVAGTERGLAFLDPHLTPVAHLPGPVEALAAARGPDGVPVVAAVLSEGRIVGLRGP